VFTLVDDGKPIRKRWKRSKNASLYQKRSKKKKIKGSRATSAIQNLPMM
jgi:hypothetical protein